MMRTRIGSTGRGRWLLAGAGLGAALLAAVATPRGQGGFDGVANYEMCSPVRGGGSLENLDAYAGHYVAWMREHGFAS